MNYPWKTVGPVYHWDHGGGHTHHHGDDRIIVSHKIPRVEGHGGIKLRIGRRDRKVKDLIVDVEESPRFFEEMLVGHRFDEIAPIISRICGICSIGHTIASIKATEKAFGIHVSKQTLRLRKVIVNAATLQSHVLHAVLLVLPDLLGLPSMFPLAEAQPDLVRRALWLKKLANDLCDSIGGRTTHPVTLVVGGMTDLPRPVEHDMPAEWLPEEVLEEFGKRLELARPHLGLLVDLLKTLAPGIPQFARERELIALKSDADYGLYDGCIFSNDTGEAPVWNYLDYLREFEVPHSTAKWARHNRLSYQVGAQARVSNNFDRLHPRAQEVARELGYVVPCHLIFGNTLAQVIECVHVVEDSITLIHELLDAGLVDEGKPSVTPCEGRGVAAHEVPRGLLVHDYGYDRHGRIVSANAVIPTSQNYGNLLEDLRLMVPLIADRSDDEIRHECERVVREKDPCISCSVHKFLQTEFVE